MGQGFPTRLTRAVLGPKHEDEYPVENPKTQIGAATYDAVFWNVSGMNLIVPRAALLASWNSGGSVFDIHHQAEAWNPDGAQGHPALARAGAGNYTYQFASTYMDEDAIARAITLFGARLTDRKVLTAFSDRLEARAWVDSIDPLKIQLRLWDTGGTLVDAPFWLEVF